MLQTPTQGYTKVPAEMVEGLYGMPLPEVRVAAVIIRHTLGYHQETYKYKTFRRLAHEAEVDAKRVSLYLTMLMRAGFITHDPARRTVTIMTREFPVRRRYVKFPNHALTILSTRSLTLNEVRLFLYILRQTVGYRRSSFQYESYRQISRDSGITYRRLSQYLISLWDKGLITIDKKEKLIIIHLTGVERYAQECRERRIQQLVEKKLSKLNHQQSEGVTKMSKKSSEREKKIGHSAYFEPQNEDTKVGEMSYKDRRDVAQKSAARPTEIGSVSHFGIMSIGEILNEINPLRSYPKQPTENINKNINKNKINGPIEGPGPIVHREEKENAMGSDMTPGESDVTKREEGTDASGSGIDSRTEQQPTTALPCNPMPVPDPNSSSYLYDFIRWLRAEARIDPYIDSSNLRLREPEDPIEPENVEGELMFLLSLWGVVYHGTLAPPNYISYYEHVNPVTGEYNNPDAPGLGPTLTRHTQKMLREWEASLPPVLQRLRDKLPVDQASKTTRDFFAQQREERRREAKRKREEGKQ